MERINKTTVLFFTLLLGVNIFLFSKINQINYIALSLGLFFYLVTNLAINIGWHRYYCHNMFKVNKITEFLFLFIGGAALFGNINTWVIEHNLHHNNKKNDIFNPHNNFLSGLFWWAFKINLDSTKIFKNYRENKLYIFFNKYYILNSLIVNTLFFIITYSISKDFIQSLFFSVTLRINLFHFIYSLSHQLGHSENKILNKFSFLNLGEGDHKLHHQYPQKNNLTGVSFLTYNLIPKVKKERK